MSNSMLYLGIIYMPQICNMGLMALLPLRRKACWGFSSPWKILAASAGFEPVNLGTYKQHATPRPPKPLSPCLTCSSIISFTYACHTEYSKSYTVMIHNTRLLFADRKGRICTFLLYLVAIYEQKWINVIECLNFIFQHHVFLVTVQGMW